MTTAAIILTIVCTQTVNPISVASSLMAASILVTPFIYKNMTSSWIPLILILTFSSGMMTLFMYAASLASNEANKNKMKKSILVLVLFTPPTLPQTKTQTSMKSFSSYSMILVLATILMITLAALSQQAHNPNQALSSSF